MKGQSTGIQPMREGTPLKLVSADQVFGRMKAISDLVARRAYEIFENTGRLFGKDLEHWLQAESEFLHPVHLDLVESEGALTVRAEVPGFKANELEVSVEPHRLTIAGKRESKEERRTGKTVYSERSSDQIFRVVDLPAEVDAGKVTATLKDGVLELVMPKAAVAKKVRVATKSA